MFWCLNLNSSEADEKTTVEEWVVEPKGRVECVVKTLASQTTDFQIIIRADMTVATQNCNKHPQQIHTKNALSRVLNAHVARMKVLLPGCLLHFKLIFLIHSCEIKSNSGVQPTAVRMPSPSYQI